jgi:predicted nucleic acid-binding protein
VILVDTNVLVALGNNADTNHEAAQRLLATHPGPLLVPPTVIAEVCHLIGTRDRGGPDAEAAFLENFDTGPLTLTDLTPGDVHRMASLVRHYADLRLGGTDASLVAIAERLGIDTIATFDRRDFNVVRPAHIEAFTLLPE